MWTFVRACSREGMDHAGYLIWSGHLRSQHHRERAVQILESWR